MAVRPIFGVRVIRLSRKVLRHDLLRGSLRRGCDGDPLGEALTVRLN
jgi:hypothetical protein